MLHELWDEFKQVVLGRGRALDVALPPLLFVGVNWLFGFTAAMGSALGLALLFTAVRLWQRQAVWGALGGVGGVLLAIVIVRFLDRSEGFFLPAIASSGLTAVLALVSIVVKRPLVAWTSYVTRRWPLGWYWHARVRPAYSEVT